MGEPLVSIVIPGYRAKYLAQAIESALAQTYGSVEILLSDNCPTDEVKGLVERYPGVRYFRNPIRSVYANFRNCIRLAKGEFVKYLLDDDLLAPTCVEKLLQGFSEYKDATLVTSSYLVIDANGRKRQLRKLANEGLIVSSRGGAAPQMLMSAKNPIGPLTTSLFRRTAFPLGIGPFFFTTDAPKRYFGLIDMTIILDLAFQGRVIAYPEPLSAMRIHPDQLSNARVNPLGICSLTSWLPLAEDAYAFGLIRDSELDRAKQSILETYRRFVSTFPQLANDLADLEASVQGGRIQNPSN
jgi:glycosyltransferase involved in cell wall biosynthesis